MTTTEDAVDAEKSFGSGPLDLWVERTGSRTYVGRNGRGGEVRVGPQEDDGSFAPGELMKLALAACTGLTTDVVLARRLGDDFAASIRVSGAKDQDADRYPLITEQLIVDLSALGDKDRERLLTIVHRAAEEHCTVGRTLTGGTSVQLRVIGESGD